MAHFFVSINEGQKIIIGQQIIKVVKNTHTFNEIYEAVTEGVFGESDVKYIDPHHDTLAARSLYLSCIFKELNLYQHNKYYNKFYHARHRKKEPLKRKKLEQLAKSLELSINQPWTTNIVKRYAEYLQRVNNEINAYHISNILVQNLHQDLQVYTIEGSLKINNKYQELSDFLLDKNNYEFFDFEEYISSNPIQKYHYIKNLQLKFPITIYWYHQDNYLENLPKYFTCQMRKNVLNKYSIIKKVISTMLRTLYYDLTSDASATSNSICKEIEDQLRIMITFEDSSIIVDLQTNNGFKEKEFDTFWNKIEAYFNEYLREFAILHRNHTCFIAADNKHKVPIGEGVATSTGVCNKKSMISTNAVLMHSFYDGKVFVSYKDILFQPSNAIKHATEFYNAIQSHYGPIDIPPILCLYTDGGLNHRTTFGSMQISLFYLFFHSDFDMFITLQTASYHSWANLVETNSKSCKKNPDFKNELKECIRNVQNLLCTRTEQLVLHDIPFETKNPTDEETIKEFFEIKKCNNIDCNVCNIIRLPQNIFESISFLLDPIPAQFDNDHYANFKNVYDTETTE
ncbi:hypothetical protein C1645_833474 [Glomus cerebriforme]|uniref:Uncharacterized protein n=1 Tax=Glomus cerebriforme TaxID=658196 RepID=A0A397SFL8_9GLOM|nr:hypothetical protein C1645_833474 [Glomus cerebriforme]